MGHVIDECRHNSERVEGNTLLVQAEQQLYELELVPCDLCAGLDLGQRSLHLLRVSEHYESSAHQQLSQVSKPRWPMFKGHLIESTMGLSFLRKKG